MTAWRALSGAVAIALMIPAVASAHAEVSPKVSLSGKLQLYSLAVPTEKSGVTTARVVLTVPNGRWRAVLPSQGYWSRSTSTTISV